MKLFSFSLALISVLLISSCAKDDGDGLAPVPDPDPDATVTYNGNVKAIIDGNCLNCHGNPTSNGAPMSLTTYAEVVSAVNNRSLVARINSATNPMPQAGLMSQANRDVIAAWVDAGLPEN